LSTRSISKLLFGNSVPRGGRGIFATSARPTSACATRFFSVPYLRQSGWVLSDTTVARILSGADLQPHRQKMWLTSHEDEFRIKRDDVLHVYYDTK
jgi:hypothetical protein